MSRRSLAEPVKVGRPGRRTTFPEIFDRAFWLANCEGFRVDRGGRDLGYVEEVRGADDPDEPMILIVRAGRLGRRVISVAIDEVDHIVPRAERIWLRSSGTED